MDTGYYISKKDYNTIINYATAAYETMKCEIGGMSVCYQDEDGDWVVTDPVIIKQEVTGSTCDLDKAELAKYYCRAAKKHGKRNFRFCWWHSHHTMGVFWSGTDIKGINEYSDGDLSFALVVNLKRENKFRISMWKPVIMHEDTTLQILESKGSSVPKKILDEVEELCKRPTVPTYTSGSWKKNDKQTTVWDNDTYQYNRGFYGYGYGDYAETKINHGTSLDDKFFDYCYEKLEYWIQELSEGRMTPSEYIKECKETNDELKRMKSDCTLFEIGKSEIDETLEMSDPMLWIRFNSEVPLKSRINREKNRNGVRT